MSTVCEGCGAPFSVGDRLCFACQRPLERTLVNQTQSRDRAFFPAPPVEQASGTNSVEDNQPAKLGIELRWGRYSQVVDVPREGMTIGSTSAADLVVPATFLQPVHARVHFDGRSWMIEALSEEACILVKGEEVEQASLIGVSVLRLGDRIGNVVTFRVLAPAAVASAPGTALRGALPSQGGELVIGQAASCGIRLEHPLVRASHARLWRDSSGALFVEDNASVAGTYLNGDRLRGRSRLVEGDTLQIGPYSARIGAGELVALEQVGGIDIGVYKATLYVASPRARSGGKPRTLLNEISLHIRPGSLTAIAGPSGAGKSTLMRLLSGQVTAQEGVVAYNGEDLKICRRAHAPLMGFVPQDDIVHADLSVYEALDYQARLRLAADITADARALRIDRSLRFVGLLDQRDQLIRTLSGGQRKRVSIASELLNEPEILFLDEPTSGLDPGLDKRMMLLLRLLADQGRTIVLTTHAITHVDVCDTLVVVGPGGQVIYAGAPSDVTAWFEVESLGDVFSLVETTEVAAEAAARVRGAERPEAPASLPERRRAVGVELVVGSPAWRQAVLRQAKIFASRQVRLLSRDRGALAFNLLQGIAVALLTALVTTRPLVWSQGGSSAMFILGCAAAWFGMINSVRELVKERAIWRREQIAGGLVPAYLASKLGILTSFAAFQSVTTVIVLDETLGLPRGGPLGMSFITITLTLFLANLSGVALGLAVSALAPSSDRAMTIVPYLLIPQLVLSGVLFKLGGLTFISWIVASRWSVSALGGIAGISARAQGETAGLYPHSAGGLILTWIMQMLLTGAEIALCARVLRRQASKWSVG